MQIIDFKSDFLRKNKQLWISKRKFQLTNGSNFIEVIEK